MRDLIATILGTIGGIIAFFLTSHYLVNWNNASYGEDLKQSVIFGGIMFGILFSMTKIKKYKLNINNQ